MFTLRVFLWMILEISVITGQGQSGDPEATFSQNIDQTNEGSEFFVGFFRNRFGRASESEVIPPVLWITTRESTQVNFSIFTIFGLVTSEVVTYGQIKYVNISNEFVVFDSTEDNNEDSRFKGIHIKAQDNKKIVVFGQNEDVASNDAFLAYPIITLTSGRYEYIVASVRGDAGTAQQAKDSVALIIGSENDTEIILEPSVFIPHPFASPITGGNFIPGTPVEFRTVTIQRFQTFYLQLRGEDISGTRIIANKSISVFSGHECANVPLDSYPCDMLVEQIQPIDSWGTEVVTIPLRTRSADIIKVFASQDFTSISITHTNIINDTVISDPSFILNRNQFRELVIGDFTLIESNYKIGVFQYSRSSSTDNVIDSDPFMLTVPSREQYHNNYVVAPAPFDPSIEGTVDGRVAYVNYTNIAIPVEYFNASLITVNNNTINASEFKPIRRADNSIWGYGAQLLLDGGAQLISHQDPNAALSVTLYGFANQMSWGCTGGIRLVAVDLITSITVIALDPEVVGQILILDCSSDVSHVSSTENQIVSQSLILRCSVNTIRPVTEGVMFIWSSNNTTLRIGNEVRKTQDHYVISQLNTSNDGQVYTCEVIINTIPPVNANGTIVLDLNVPTFSVTVSLVNSLQEVAVGDSTDIHCIAEIAFNGVEPSSVIFQWLGPEGISITNNSRVAISPTNSFASIFNSTLHFSYLMEGDDGLYTCNVMILRANQSDSIELRRLNIPTPNVIINAMIYNAIAMIVGQPLVLECVVTAVRGINSQVNILWSNINSNEELRKMNVTASVTMFGSVVYRDYLNISQLTTENNDVTYECKIMINDVVASNRFTLYVTVPDFIVEMSPVESLQGGIVGNKQTIHCGINIVNGVTLNSVIVNWIGPKGIPVVNNSRITITAPTISGSNYFTSSLQFMYLMERDKGTYVCNVSILQTSTSMMVELGALTVPTPIVSISVETNQTVGQPLTLDCTVITVRGITSGVNIVWLVNDLELETVTDVDVSSSMDDDMQQYMVSYTIDQLSVNDNENVYQCVVLIDSDSLVMAADNFTLNITGMITDNNISDNSNTSWTIIGVFAGVLTLITIIAILLCLILLRKRAISSKTLNMKKAELNPYRLNDTTHKSTIKSLNAASMQISIDEWKKELAAYLIDYNSLDIKDSIASGKFGVVYKGLYTTKESTIIEVAIKTVKYFSSSTAENFIKECNIANKFDHPNVLSLIGVCIIPEEAVPLMVMPYMHHGDVRSFIKSKRADNIKADEFPPDLGEEILAKICLDIAKGMEYLATRHFVHRDLAARNCMLDKSMTVKVADFGLSRDVYVTEYYTMSQSIPLPVKWLAPEALFDRHFSEKTDIWAFGVTCWEVFSLGLQPYPLIGPSEIGDYIKSGKVLDKPQLSSDEMYEIMSSCWKFKPDERPNFRKVVKKIENLKVTLPNQPAVSMKKISAAYLPLYS